MGIVDLTKKYNLKEIVKGDSIFCATGITNGDLVEGIKIKDNKYITETLVTHKGSNMCKIVLSEDTIKTWKLLYFTIKEPDLVPSSIG